MKGKLPSPITRENLSESWELVDTERRIAKKKYITTKVSSFFSNLAFAFLALLAGNGIIYNTMSGSYCDYLEHVPLLLPAWDKFSSYFLKPGQNWQTQLILTLLVVYALCFVICGIFVLLVTAVYHPRKQQIPEGTPKETAAQMLTMARDARRYARKSGDRGSTFWALVFMMFMFCLLAMYWLTGLGSLENMMEVFTGFIMSKLDHIFTDSFSYGNAQAGLFMPAIMIFSVSLYFIYALLNLIHSASVQFMYKYHVSYSFVAEVEYYHTFADEVTEGLSEEEVLAKRKETAEAKRIEGLDLERIGAYGKAKELLAAAAHGGDSAAMEHYARHWLIAGAKDPGRFWLQRCVDTGEASEYAVRTLRRLKWHLRFQARYLK